jgi:hypothetical protein
MICLYLLSEIPIQEERWSRLGRIDAVVNAAYIIGEMAEWSNAAVSKTVVPQSRDRGFEPPSLRKDKLLPQRSWGIFVSATFQTQSEKGKETKKPYE